LKAYIAKHGGPRAFLQRSVVGEEEEEDEEGPYHSSNSESSDTTNTTLGRNGPVGGGSVLLVAPVQLPPIPPFTYNDKTTRGLLTKLGFDPDDLNKRRWNGWIPMNYFSISGNVMMIRYLVAHGADWRKVDSNGYFPMLAAAAGGHLEIMQLLSHCGGAHEDIRKVINGKSPLFVALDRWHLNFNVVYWLILIGALAPRNDVDVGGIDDATMRRDLRQEASDWSYDHRETVLAWAQTSVANHDNDVQLLFTGMIASSKQTASPLEIFNGNSGILKLIADYGVTGSPQQLRTLRQLIDRLPAFIDDTPFVPRNVPRA